MARISVRYLVRRPGRKGRLRNYWQPGPGLRAAGWSTLRLSDDLGAAVTEAEALNAAVTALRQRRSWSLPTGLERLTAALPPALVHGDRANATRRERAPRTLADLIQAYRRSDAFRCLRASTRRSYEDNLRTLERWGGDAPLEALTPARFTVLSTELQKATPTKAKAVVGMARILFQWGRSNDHYSGYRIKGVLIAQNPATDLNLRIEKFRRSEADLWTEEEVAIFAAVAEMMGLFSVGAAVELNAWLGQRQGDLLALSPAQYRQGEIFIEQRKTGARVSLPVAQVPHLAELLDELLARHRRGRITATTLLFDERSGRAWTTASFRHAFDAVRAAANSWCETLARRQFMLLRHTAIVRLAEAGCTTEEISAISGHSLRSVDQILECYLVRTRSMARRAFRRRLQNDMGPRGET